MALLAVSVQAQTVNGVRRSILDQVVPGADRFERATGNPPVRRAYKGDQLVGYVFLTSDVPPVIRGYAGPIVSVVGMTPDGTLTGVRVIDYHETYMKTRGDFLRETPGFQEQFAGKSVGDPFQVREDIDGISRVSISVRAMTRSVRQAARGVAVEYMKAVEELEAPVEDVASMTWFDIRSKRVAERFEVQDLERDTTLGMSVIHLQSDALAEHLIGGLYKYAQEAAVERGGVEEMILYVVDGSRPRLETREGWSIVQDGRTFEIPTDDVAMLGAPWEGALQEETSLVGVIMLHGQVDVARPMTFVYDQGADYGSNSVDYTSQVALAAMVEAAATESAVVAAPAAGPADAEDAADEAATDAAATTVASADGPDDAAPPAQDASGPAPSASTPPPRATAASPSSLAQLDMLDLAEEPQPSFIERVLTDTSWGRMGWMALVLALATLAFFTKRTWLRWTSLVTTFVVLGYVDGGFLSVSHITATIWVGPQVILGDLPLLAMVTFTLVAVLFFGRIFCGYLCPFGALQDFIDAVVPKRFQKALPPRGHRLALKAKYGILAIIVVPALLGSEASLYQYFEPFGTVFSIGPSKLLWTIAGAILIASAVVPRFYCRYACPLGAALAIGSLFSINRIKRVEQCDFCKVCERKCPTGAIDGPTVDFKECVRCNACEIELIEKNGVCRHDMETIRPRLVQLKTSAGAGLADAAVRDRAD
jgi:Na+-translocating ferredoxin:NAD+ oxidoreductase RnfG subunit